MKIVLFAHSLVSDWSHGNAHFLRGLLRALAARGHDVVACEPSGGWSIRNLVEDHGHGPILEFTRRFSDLNVQVYGEDGSLLEEVTALTRGADLVLVHEFNDPALVGAVGEVRRRGGGFTLFFHDTHHRAVSAPHEMAQFNLEHYDGVLAFGESLAELWRRQFDRRAWTFHEAADTTVFEPMELKKTDDVVWIGNWGDEERSREIRDYLVRSATLMPDVRFAIHGVRYPEDALRDLREAGVSFRGWIPNYRVPEAFGRAKLTVHIPRGPYLDRLPGIPTIRPFEALACGIPLVSSPWPDVEGLFTAGEDYVSVRSPEEMREAVRRLVSDHGERERLAERGRARILEAHTCDHRAEQLESIHAEALEARGQRTRSM
ncbi:MAG TPA: glycosyltransferase [Longimicrobiales bacterium]|nr:glycosyltransferase [Longimicrobiales bacterium]